MRKVCLVACVLLLGLPGRTRAQDQVTSSSVIDALQAALEHIRHSDLPRGPLALVDNGIAKGVATSLAGRLSASIRASTEVVECHKPVDEPSFCKFKGDLAGAVGVTRMRRIAADRFQAVVWSRVLVNGTHRRSWIHWREYQVDLEHKNGRWEVAERKLLTQS